LNVIVLVKQVPDTRNIKGDVMTPEGTINRDAMAAIFNPDDMHALEAALQIKDNYPDTKVSAITMGPPAAAAVLKECLYRGADFTALVSDRAFAGADTQATSYALKCAIEKIGASFGAVDLVFCGRQAIDGETAQVGPETAEKLGINQITSVSKIEKLDPAKKEIVAVRSIEGGRETVKAKLPILLTFNEEGEALRPASAVKALACKRTVAGEKNLALWDIAAIKADPLQCGLSGSPTRVKELHSVTASTADIKYINPDEAGVTELIHELIADHTFE